jgi:hypothetical protein
MSVEPSGADGPEALFVPDGARLVPTERARGPWSPTSLHGGPVAALAARAAEGVPGGEGLQLVRLTLELLRPVPLAPLEVTGRLVKPGRTVQLVDSVVEADGVEVAWSRALRIRRDDTGQRVEPTVPEGEAPAPPDGVDSTEMVVGGLTAFHNRGVEMRFVAGRTNRPGPATVWIRLRVPVVLGEEPSPWQRAAAVADFGNGVAAELDFATSVFINPDLTVSIHRPPVGEWICLDARTRFGTPGIGAAESALWDVEGRVGRAVQSLVVETPSPTAPPAAR